MPVRKRHIFAPASSCASWAIRVTDMRGTTKTASQRGWTGALAAAVGVVALATAAAQDKTGGQEPCPRLLPGETIPFAGLYPAIEARLALSNFEAGQIVEIDPHTMSLPRATKYISGLHALGARVSIYLIGGHCEIGPDCDALPDTVQLGSTGSWNWDKTERRILNITHPAVLARLAKGIENGWNLGANYIRIDNLHHPAGSAHPRTPAEMKTIIDLGQTIEDRLRAAGAIEPTRVTGLVAHNNLVAWERLVEQGELRRPPALLTSERTGQLAALAAFEGDDRMKRGRLAPPEIPDLQAGRRLAEHFQIPYSIVEFRRSHDLAHSEQTYPLPQLYVDTLQRLSGVTEVIVIPDESQYVGRAEVFWGNGPRTLPKTPDLAAPVLAGRACALAPLAD
jgi:hypothetical protein